jgi:DNA-binding CsgD family transcriptional regulator
MHSTELDELCAKLAVVLRRSPARREIVRLLCEGLQPKHIAAQMKRSIDTTKTQIRILYRQTGIPHRGVLLLIAPRALALAEQRDETHADSSVTSTSKA